MTRVAIALTFDAEFPDREQSDDPREGIPKILDALRQYGVPATFFVQGRFAQAYPTQVGNIAQAGHMLGNHLYSHASIANLKPAGFLDELTVTNDILEQMGGGRLGPFWRAPYGSGVTTTVYDKAKAKGLLHCAWNWTPADWDPFGARDEYLARWETVREGVALLHTWPSFTVQCIKVAIKKRLDAGDKFITLEEAMSV